MCCLAFFDFLQVCEFTIPSESLYDPTTGDVQLYIGAKDNTICPIKALLSYLAARGSQAGPLFITKQGRGITRQILSSALDTLLTLLKLDYRHYNTHSFRIGAANSSAQAMIPDSQIKILGHCKVMPTSITSRLPVKSFPS